MGVRIVDRSFPFGPNGIRYEHLKKLADPELRKNVQGDPALQASYDQMKDGLTSFVAESRYNFGLPIPLIKAVTAMVPWFLIGATIVFATSDRKGVKGALVGMVVVATPFVIIAMLLPSFSRVWINYVLYPVSSTALALISIWAWQHYKKPDTSVAVTE